MSYIIGLLTVVLVIVIVLQVGKINEIAGKLRGEKQAAHENNEWTARLMVIFMVLFLIGSVWSAIYYKDSMLGYGPNYLPAKHARDIMGLFNTTLFFTGVVFVLTQIALFWFAYKYRAQEGRKALYIPHDNKLEIVWTAIPAIVMAVLVVFGLSVWNDTMADVSDSEIPIGFVEEGKDSTYLEIEATGMQFAWMLRHPGRDGKLGEKNYLKIDAANNPLGQDFSDPKNIDDIHIDELVLPVNHKIRVRITSRDVLHNFDLPHFFVKMDAIPGMPTYFIFTPDETTEEYRDRLSKHPDWQVPADPDEPDGKKRWEAFHFELACAELCGKSHYSMRKIVRIVEVDEYNAWLKNQEAKSFYLANVRGKGNDPFLDKPMLRIEKMLADRAAEEEAAKKAKEEADKKAEEEEAESTPEGEEGDADADTDADAGDTDASEEDDASNPE